VTASRILPRWVGWIWAQWLPAGKLCIFDGDPDAGKSTVSLDLVARITSGARMPDGTPGIMPADALLLSAEDDMEDTISWRLMAAGADLDRVHHIPTAFDASGDIPLTLPRDIDLIELEAQRRGVRIIIVDVLDEYFDDRVDPYKNAAVRKALQPVRAVAARTGAAVIALRHFTKEAKPKAIYRGGGSIGIVGVARAAWAIGIHPEDVSTRVLAVTKMNLAPRPNALAFKLMRHETYPCAYVDWRGVVDINADQLLDPASLKGAEEAKENKSKTQQCHEAIVALLSQGDMWSNELYDAVVKDLQVGRRTFDAVRAEITFAWPEKMPDGTRAWRVRLK
jgi:hypothetical protein